MPAPKNPATTGTAEAAVDTALYVVTIAGACYRTAGDPDNIGLAHHGRVVELDDAEASRLLKLGAVRAAEKADVDREQERRDRESRLASELAEGPSDNPFGGRPLGDKSLEQHAAEQIALAKKAGALK